VPGESDDDRVVGIAVRKRGEFGFDRRTGGVRVREQTRVAAQRIGEQRIQRRGVAPRATQIADGRRLIAIDADEQSTERHGLPHSVRSCRLVGRAVDDAGVAPASLMAWTAV
jgi:hypothetical protein